MGREVLKGLLADFEAAPAHLRLSLDDLLAVVREFIEPAMSRSALDRLLRRRGVNRLPEPEVEKTQVKSLSRRC